MDYYQFKGEGFIRALLLWTTGKAETLKAESALIRES